MTVVLANQSVGEKYYSESLRRLRTPLLWNPYLPSGENVLESSVALSFISRTL